MQGESSGGLRSKWHELGQNVWFARALLLIVNQAALRFKACGHGGELPARQTT